MMIPKKKKFISLAFKYNKLNSGIVLNFQSEKKKKKRKKEESYIR